MARTPDPMVAITEWVFTVRWASPSVPSASCIPPQATVGMSIVGMATDGSPVQSKVAAVRNVKNAVVFVVADNREVPQDQTGVLGNVITDVNAIIGRVVRKDKRVGMAFREDT